MSTTVFYSKAMNRILTPKESYPVMAQFRKKGCTSCKPIAAPTHSANELVKTATEISTTSNPHGNNESQ